VGEEYRWVIFRMRNFSNKICRENQKKKCVLYNDYIPKIVPFMRWCGKMWYSQTGHRWQYDVQKRCDLHAG
jgi:hypothetical protein